MQSIAAWFAAHSEIGALAAVGATSGVTEAIIIIVGIAALVWTIGRTCNAW